MRQIIKLVVVMMICDLSAAQVPPTAPISMTVKADAPTIAPGHKLQFRIHFSDGKSHPVIWKVNDKEGGDANTVGTITSSGLYTAPAHVPDRPSVKISANLSQDTSSSVSLVIVEPEIPVRCSSSLPGAHDGCKVIDFDRLA